MHSSDCMATIPLLKQIVHVYIHISLYTVLVNYIYIVFLLYYKSNPMNHNSTRRI